MTRSLAPLFEAVRGACSPADWSRGVELTRAGAVVGEGEKEDGVVFQITSRRGMISRSITLFPEDEDWECGCSNPNDACEHVAAAIISWRRAIEQGESLPQPRFGAGRLGYRFTRSGTALALSRVIVQEDREHPLESTLAGLAQGRVAGPAFVAAQVDLAVELALGTHRRGPLPRQLVEKVFKKLVHAAGVQLDGHEIGVSAEPVQPVAFLEDQDEGFRLTVREDPTVSETFSNGIARCGELLRPIGETRLTGRELAELPRGRYIPADQLALLLTETLPGLRKRIPVEILTTRLPETAEEPPRAHVEIDREGQTLKVLASVVYGTPPRSRVVGGRLIHGHGPVPLRDETREKQIIRRLQRELGLLPGHPMEFEGEEGVSFTAKLESWEGRVEGQGKEFFRLAPTLSPRLDLDGTRLEVGFESRGGGGTGRADASDVLNAWREGKSLVPLLDGAGWAPLPVDWLERFGHRIADLISARGADGKIAPSSLPDLGRLCEALDQPPPPELAGLRDLMQGFEQLETAELPADLRAELRSYQQQGVNWLAFLRQAGLGGLLADDMGLGKTLQALCAVKGRTLVVAPTSVLHNWQDEIERFRPGLRSAVYHGPRRELDPEADVTLTTYAILRIDAERLAQEVWDTVVLDEAQAIKNPDSQVAAAAFRLRAGFRLTLTGTPVENRLEELWSQFHFINRGLLGGRRDFAERYAKPIAEGQEGVAERLRERVRPFVLRRLKRDVAPELPPRTDMVLRCELDETERETYETIRAAAREDVVRKLGAGGNVLAALEALLRLRQAACHSALVPGHEASRSSKLDLLLEMLDSILAEGHKALVFSQWTSLLDLTEPLLEEAGVNYLRLDGSTVDRAGVVRRFQDAEGPPVLLISLKAGGTGLNLTRADHIFLLDPWWNPAVEDQAADRAHRIGQDRPVMVYRLVAEETVEERILDLQQRKREIAAAALEDAAAAASITREELLDLLR